MFIIVIGTRASGKSTIKEYLIKKEGFKHVRLVYDGKPEEDSSSFRYKLDKFAGSVQSVVSRPSHAGEGTVYGEGPSAAPNYARSVVSEPDISEGQVKLEIPPVQAPPGSFLSQTSSTPAALVESDAVGELDGAIGFTDPKRLLEHITRHWRENFVTEDITTREVLEPFLKRPSVLLVRCVPNTSRTTCSVLLRARMMSTRTVHSESNSPHPSFRTNDRTGILTPTVLA